MKIDVLIRNKRREKNLTQQELADILFVSSKTISKWETGRGLPELASINNLSLALGISPDELMGSVNETTESSTKEIDFGIRNAIIISTVLLSVGVFIACLGFSGWFRGDEFVPFFITSFLAVILSFGTFFIMENGRNAKIGYRKLSRINRERMIMLWIWIFGLCLVPLLQYATFLPNNGSYSMTEVVISISIEYGVLVILFVLLYRLLIKK
ncbi:MAG: helix-turn-helix domain-containing protein [Candidatus Izemoplasmatales bacterium]